MAYFNRKKATLHPKKTKKIHKLKTRLVKKNKFFLNLKHKISKCFIKQKKSIFARNEKLKLGNLKSNKISSNIKDLENCVLHERKLSDLIMNSNIINGFGTKNSLKPLMEDNNLKIEKNKKEKNIFKKI